MKNHAAAALLLPLMTLTVRSGFCLPVAANANAHAAGVPTEQNATATIPLRFARPSDVVKVIVWPSTMTAESDAGQKQQRGTENPPQPRSLIPVGVSALTPDDVQKTLTVHGTPAGVAEVRNIVRVLDVEPRAVRLEVRVLRSSDPAPEAGRPFDAEHAMNGAVVVTGGMVQTTNNRRVEIDALGDGQGFRIELAPHVNGDGSVSLQVKAAMESSDAPGSSPTRRIEIYQRGDNGKPMLVGALGAPAGSYLVEVRPTLLGRQTAQAARMVIADSEANQ